MKSPNQMVDRTRWAQNSLIHARKALSEVINMEKLIFLDF